jgi:glycosyltransferase involved in cell wall biosynthesis
VTDTTVTGKRVLMIAYTNYEIDPRVIREAEAAVSGGFAVDFLALRRENDPALQEVRGVRVIRLNQRRYRGGGTIRYILAYLEFFIRCLCKSVGLHLRHPYAVVHVNNMPDFLVFCTLPLKLLGVKVILDIHDPMPDTFVSKFKNGEAGLVYKLLLWQERLSAWFADRVVTVHDPVKDCVLVKHGHAPESITVVANFADEELFCLRDNPPVNGKVRMVFHGTILERYGLGNLIVALSKTRNRQKIALKIIGEGDFSARLKELITAHGLEDSVQFVNRAFPLREVPAMLADCHFGIVPLEISAITNYALPLKLMEYVSMGLPVVTVKNAAISYYFTENDCLFFQPNDIASLSAVLDRVAENPQLLVECRERVVALREKFFWSNEKRKYLNLLHELAAN